MEQNINKDIFERDISIEEFDHITDGVEDHVFSDEYLAGKESMMKNSYKAKISKLGIKVAAAASAIVVASPFVVNAATGGELFNRLWGNEGKENIESHVIFVNEVKTGRDGETYETHYEITYPAVEYVEADPELAERLIGNRMTTEPVSFTVGDNSQIAAGAVVLTEIPPNCTAVGVPAQVIKENGERIPLDQIHIPNPVQLHLDLLDARVRELEEKLNIGG